MTLVVDADREVADASLVRSAPEAPSYQGLDRAGQRLARGLGEFLGGLMAAPATTSVAPVRLEKMPASDGLVLGQLRLAPLEALVAVAMDRSALMRLVDLYYGGEGSVVSDRERLTPAELRFFGRIVAGLCDLIPAAFQPMSLLAASVDDEAGEASALVQVFTITVGDGPAFGIEVRYPEAILGALPGPEADGSVDADNLSDHSWQARLMDCALHVTFPVRAVFAEPELPLARLMSLRPGDIIPVCLPAQIDLTVAGLRLARGSAGESNGRAAICIEHL